MGAMEIFNGMIQAQQQLASAKSVQNILDIVVGLISELTSFHRVMFYRFDSQKNDCVDAELVNPQASEDLFRGKSLCSSSLVFVNLFLGAQFPGFRYSETSPRPIQDQQQT